jgi:hypothetical protein
MLGSPVKDQIQQRHLGLPPGQLPTSLPGWDEIAEATAALRLLPGGTLVDLARGRGGYGLEIADRTGAWLIGVDFSAEALRRAREHARKLAAQNGMKTRPGPAASPSPQRGRIVSSPASAPMHKNTARLTVPRTAAGTAGQSTTSWARDNRAPTRRYARTL